MPFCLGESDPTRLHRSQAGPVGDTEILCRGIFRNHVKSKGFVRLQSVIRKGDLINGGISLWRKDQIGDDAAVRTLLQSLSEEPLLDVVWLEAHKLRAIRINGHDGRPLCLVDDTQTSAPDAQQVTTHEAHACLAPCKMAQIHQNLDQLDLLMTTILNLFPDKV